jgi:hypothetical protein
MDDRPPIRDANIKAQATAMGPKGVAQDILNPKRPREPLYVVLLSGIVIGLIIMGLFVSASAVAEKVRMSHGYGAILDIVDKARHTAASDRQLGNNGRQDLLATLERLGQIITAGESDGIRILRNPWGGIVVALAMPDNAIRIETIVPTHVCQRFISFLFDQDPQALGLRAIEVKPLDGPWRQTYVDGSQVRATDPEIAASCGGSKQADVALLFTLRSGNEH